MSHEQKCTWHFPPLTAFDPFLCSFPAFERVLALLYAFWCTRCQLFCPLHVFIACLVAIALFWWSLGQISWCVFIYDELAVMLKEMTKTSSDRYTWRLRLLRWWRRTDDDGFDVEQACTHPMMMMMTMMMIYILWCSVCLSVCHKKSSLPPGSLL